MGRGGEEAEALYEYVKEELESRKSKCMDYISQIPQVFDGVNILCTIILSTDNFHWRGAETNKENGSY